MEKRLTADLNVVANSNLEIQLLDGDLNVIQKLDDEPNDVGGLTSAELKAKFDESGNIIKKYINETLIPAVLAEDATEESRKQAEAARVAAEQGRVTAEEGRVSAEAARAAAEQARSEAESSRVSAENTRAQAETARVSAEASRSQDEAARKSAESTRQANETARQNAESARQTAETNRAQTETARNVWEDYDSAKNYQPGNKVYWQGSSYVCLKPCSGISPENGTYWQLVVRSGFTSDSAFGFDVVNGRLLCYYSGDNPPPFRLGNDGHLYVDLDKTYDLGKVTGGSGESLVVEFSVNVSGGNKQYSCNHTYSEIWQACDDGRPITALIPVDSSTEKVRTSTYRFVNGIPNRVDFYAEIRGEDLDVKQATLLCAFVMESGPARVIETDMQPVIGTLGIVKGVRGDLAGYRYTSAEPNVDYMPPVPITKEDNGKFMRVVNGAWAAQEIANANGGSF